MNTANQKAVATRELRLHNTDGTVEDLLLLIYQPSHQEEDGPWQCRCRIECASWAEETTAYGEDAFQAMELAFQWLHVESVMAEREGKGLLKWPDGEAYTDGAAAELMKIISTLEDKRVKLNVRDKWGRSLLHDAAASGLKGVVEYLIFCGSGVNIKDNEGRTPLDIAVSKRHEGIAELLREHGGISGLDPNP